MSCSCPYWDSGCIHCGPDCARLHSSMIRRKLSRKKMLVSCEHEAGMLMQCLVLLLFLCPLPCSDPLSVCSSSAPLTRLSDPSHTLSPSSCKPLASPHSAVSCHCQSRLAIPLRLTAASPPAPVAWQFAGMPASHPAPTASMPASPPAPTASIPASPPAPIGNMPASPPFCPRHSPSTRAMDRTQPTVPPALPAVLLGHALELQPHRVPPWSHWCTVKHVCALMRGMLLLGVLLLARLLPRMRMCTKVHASQIGC